MITNPWQAQNRLEPDQKWPRAELSHGMFSLMSSSLLSRDKTVSRLISWESNRIQKSTQKVFSDDRPTGQPLMPTEHDRFVYSGVNWRFRAC